MSNPVWLISALLGGFLYAFLLYSKKHTWSVQINFLIAFVRFILVSLLIFLLISPYFKIRETLTEKPVIAMVIDNSKSVRIAPNLTKDLENLQKLAEKFRAMENIRFEIFLLNGDTYTQSINNLSFTGKATDINQILNKLENLYEGANLTDVILYSDGINNTGISPLYKNRTFALHTLATGDTTTRKDISIKSVWYNKITSSKTKFPVVAEIKHFGYDFRGIDVLLVENEKVLARKHVNLSPKNTLTRVEFEWQESELGLHHYQIVVPALPDEYNPKNNRTHLYIEVNDLQSHVLLAGATPHPDIKALHSALQNQNTIKTTLCIPDIKPFVMAPYDLAILHGFPSGPSTTEILSQLTRTHTSFLFILTTGTDLGQLHQITQDFNIMAQTGQTDKVTPSFTSEFTRFNISPEQKNLLQQSPPVVVPYGAYNTGLWEVIAYQSVGNAVTDNALIAIKLSNERNMGICTGEGIWQWRMYNFQEQNNTQAFDDLVVKLVQLLAKKEATIPFRCYPVQSIFDEEDAVRFAIECYNDLLEPVFGNTIRLRLTSEKGQNYSYAFEYNTENNPFVIKDLPSGLYKYQAETQISGKMHKNKGEFLVSTSDLEDELTQADHQMLRELSMKNDGEFHANVTSFQPQKLLEKSANPKIIQTENLMELIALPWLGLCIIALAVLEWTLRKWYGSF